MKSPPAPPPGDPTALGDRHFSLVLGGPFYQLLRRARLCDDALGLLLRRMALAVALTWLPLLALSTIGGALYGGREMPFLHDVECHLRFLLAVPLLILAEPVVHYRIQPIIAQFEERRLVRPADTARFADAVSRAVRLRNSRLAEAVLLALVYAIGIEVVWRRYASMHAVGWYAAPGGGRLSAAGFWFVFVSVPVFQFLLYRWYFRLGIWTLFLWRMSRLNLDLDATHPDKAGGLGFLGMTLVAFIPIALAHGVLVSGMIANRIVYGGAKLPEFQLEIVGAVIVLLLVFAGPLLVFAPMLAREKRRGVLAYGALGQTYVRAFEEKWLSGHAPADEPLIGTADIQSLADLSNSFGVVDQMRIAPISASAVIQFAGAILVPILPLMLTVMPAEEILQKLVGIVA